MKMDKNMEETSIYIVIVS